MACDGLLDEAHVTVDISLLERAAVSSPLLVVALLLALVGLGLALRAAPGVHRAWSLITLVAPVSGFLFWATSRSVTELTFTCLVKPAETGTRLVAIGLGIAALCFLQLCVTLMLRAWKQELRVLWPTALLGIALALSAGIAWQKHSLQLEFSRRVQAALPAPNVRPPREVPEAHLNHTLTFKPDVEAAGYATGLIFRSRVALEDDARRAWNIDTVALTPLSEGLNTVPLQLVQDLVSVDAELAVRGVRDEGPAWFPLEKGNRWEFVAVRGRGGALDKLETAIVRRKKPLPEPSLTLEVTGERERDGFHLFEVTQTSPGGEPRKHEVLRRDGELWVAGGGRIVFVDRDSCHVGLLEPSWCTCLEDRVSRCRVVSGDLGETLLRLFLGAVTLGMTELRGGMGDLGAGDEAGLLLTRWAVAGEVRSLEPPPKN